MNDRHTITTFPILAAMTLFSGCGDKARNQDLTPTAPYAQSGQPGKPTESGAKNASEVFARFVEASKTENVAAYWDTLPEPWSSAYQRLDKISKDIVRQHDRLVGELEAKFEKDDDPRRGAFGSARIARQLDALKHEFDFNPEVDFKDAKIVKQEERDFRGPLLDLDGVRVDVTKSVAITAEVTLARNQDAASVEREFVALKIGDQWKLVDGFWFAGTTFHPAQDLQDQINQYSDLLAAYRAAIGEVNGGLYKNRAELEQVMTWAFEDAFGVDALLVEPEAELAPAGYEDPPLVLHVAAGNEHGERRLFIENREVSLGDARDWLAKINGESRLLVLDFDYAVWKGDATDVFEMLLDSGYERDRIVCRFRDDGFTADDYSKLAASFKGRLRLFSRLHESSAAILDSIQADGPLTLLDDVEIEMADPDVESGSPVADMNDIPETDAQMPKLQEVPLDIPEFDLPEINFDEAKLEPGDLKTGKLEPLPASMQVASLEAAFGHLVEELLRIKKKDLIHLVWLLDQSPSMTQQRRVLISDSISRLNLKLADEGVGLDSPAKKSSKPVMTSILAYGKDVHWMTRREVDDFASIDEAIRRIEVDRSGQERVFAAIADAVNAFAQDDAKENRKLLLIVVTDEAGDDHRQLEQALALCRRWKTAVYVLGTNAPLGGVNSLDRVNEGVGFISPGRESLFPERLNLPFFDGKAAVSLNSGFGPYALSRISRETGGAILTSSPMIHPQRADKKDGPAIFDPLVMARYQPEYLSEREMMKMIQESKMRSALIAASQTSIQSGTKLPPLQFAIDEATWSTALKEAQRTTAIWEHELETIHERLKAGELHREQETSPRWQVGFDLALGRTLAMRARAMSLSLTLARGHAGLSPKDAETNTWVVTPEKLDHTSNAMNLVDESKEYLQRVVEEHPDTPWAWLAQRELAQPFGWSWQERSIVAGKAE